MKSTNLSFSEENNNTPDVKRPNICPICEARSMQVFHALQKGNYIKCNDCGLISVENFPSHNEMVARANYWAEKHHKNTVKVKQHFSTSFQKFTFKNYLELMESYRKTGYVLDVGCGIGSFVYAAKEKKWQSFGIDIGSSISVGEKYHLNIFNGKIEDMDFDAHQFDAITMFDVIEHIIDLNSLLEKTSYFLRRNGLLIIKTPNANGLSSKLLGSKWSSVQPEDHMYLFSPKSLRMVLEKYGYKVLKTQTHDINIIELFWKNKNQKSESKSHSVKRNFIRILYRSSILRTLRNLINVFVNLFKLGESIILYVEYSPNETDE